MKQSESILNLSKALFEFQSKAVKVIKKADNPFFKSKYADLPSILDEIHPHLISCGLVISQLPDGDGLTTMLIHANSGEYISANSTMHPTKSDPQSIGSAITYHRRYALCSILGLNVDEDDDGNKASAPTETPKPDLPWLNKDTQAFNQAVQHLKQGGTIADIRKKFKGVKGNGTTFNSSSKMRKFSIKMHHETRWDMVLIDNEGEAYHFRGMMGSFNMPVMKQQKRMIITLYNESAVCSVRYYLRKYVAPSGTVYGGKYTTVKSSFCFNRGELPCIDLHI